MKTGVTVKLQTGLFEWTDFGLKATSRGLTFKPAVKSIAAITVPAASIRAITFYEVRLKMEIQADAWIEVYYINEDDWFETMMVIKKTLSLKMICEMN